MYQKKNWVIMLIAAILIGCGINVNAKEADIAASNVLLDAISDLEKGYSEYYDISSISTTLCSNQEVNGNIEKIYFMEMRAVLKADCIEQMDYYQGVSDYCTTMLESTYRSNDSNSQMRMSVLYNERLDICEDLIKYIGKEQSFVFYIKETYSLANESNKEILFENGEEYVPLEEIMPLSHDELYQNGYSVMEYIDDQYAVAAENEAMRQVRTSYSSAAGVNYMIKYTSNPTTCNVCNGGCNNVVDTTKYNSNYKHYVYVKSHNDCANYLSQALCSGGIPTDGVWYPGSDAWIKVRELTDYMVLNDYWTSVEYNKVQVGDVLSFSTISHVAMITSFDGITYKYSAHSNDRLNYTITIKSSTGTFYRVL